MMPYDLAMMMMMEVMKVIKRIEWFNIKDENERWRRDVAAIRPQRFAHSDAGRG